MNATEMKRLDNISDEDRLQRMEDYLDEMIYLTENLVKSKEQSYELTEDPTKG